MVIGVAFDCAANVEAPSSVITNEADAFVFSTRSAVVADVAPAPRTWSVANEDAVVVPMTAAVVSIPFGKIFLPVP